MMKMNQLGKQARSAARLLALANTEQKNHALHCISESLDKRTPAILSANKLDLKNGAEAGLVPALLDRLMLDPQRLTGIISDLRQVIELPDPVGEIFEQSRLPNGLEVHKVRVPLGVLGIIYEARPNVTVDVAGLSLKTGNAAILRGGSETIHTNKILVDAIQAGLEKAQLPQEAIQFIADSARAHVLELLQMHEYVDMLIPRGGAALHAYCRENSRIPVITGGIGICHLYIDDSADLARSLEIIHNAKVQRPSVCNALDTVLVHQHIAPKYLPQVVARLSQSGVTFRADPSALSYLRDQGGEYPDGVSPAGPQDFDTEWLSLVLGLKVVENLDQAIEHISMHSTGHSDGILTENSEHARIFTGKVDSAAVYVNASTRFTDGGQLGLGAEVAISTQRLHARGPMGLRELTTYKWVIQGDYQVRM